MDNENPLLKRARLPGEIHRLPSRGLFYPDGVLDPNVRDGEVEIFPMMMIDEIKMRSPDLLFSGDAIIQVLAHCVPQILKPKQLLVKDVDFLTLVLRKASYGDVTIDYTHSCTDAKSHSYVIPVDNLIKAARSIDPTTLNEKFSVKLKNNAVVKIQPLLFTTFVDMMQITDTNLTPEQSNDIAIKALLDTIVSVDEITDKNQIREFLNAIPVYETNAINQVIDTAVNDWGSDTSFTFKCKDCQQEVTTAVPMNPLAFFI